MADGGAIGQAIEAALDKAGFTNDTAARVMGYGDNQTSLRRWIDGTENPQLAKLRLLGDGFWQELIIAFAVLGGVGVTVETVVRLERKRA